LPKNAAFIGILSRFEGLKIEPQPSNYQYVAMISGVEPQRTVLEKKLTELFLQTDKKCLIISGQVAEKQTTKSISNITITSHLDTQTLGETLLSAEKIYCRSGYSTLMDLWTLGIKTAVLIPTSGQTEQEYLAEYFVKKGFETLT
jgi:predicted glycosyltransferase